MNFFSHHIMWRKEVYEEWLSLDSCSLYEVPFALSFPGTKRVKDYVSRYTTKYPRNSNKPWCYLKFINYTHNFSTWHSSLTKLKGANPEDPWACSCALCKEATWAGADLLSARLEDSHLLMWFWYTGALSRAAITAELLLFLTEEPVSSSLSHLA